jgi:hypothetical protein
MWKKNVGAIAIKSMALLVVFGSRYQVLAQEAATPYPNMAPIDQYIMTDQAAEIALARSAAPKSISGDAEVLVLKSNGFETGVKGKNGFVCIVERSWTSAADSEIWNPKVRTPICYNAAAARSYLPRNIKRTNLTLTGHTAVQTDQSIIAAIDGKELPAIESGAMCYMMSKEGFGGDSVPHWPPHLMFFYPETDPANWGAGLPGSPVLAASNPAEHATTFVVVVRRWSDGTEGREAPGHHH